MAFQYSPKIITDGLVLALDAANPKSYPGSGTVWTDLSGNNNSGTLTNGPTFNSANNGSIVFDGVNDFVSLSNSITNTVYTAEFCFKMGSNDGTYGYFINSTNKGFAISEGGTANGLIYGRFYYYNGSTATASVLADIPSTTDWNFISVIIDTTTSNLKLYGNAVLLTDTSISSMSTLITNIGKYDVSGGLNFLKGNLAYTRIYNRALTAQEILQNYNATKGRFGL